jgi:hypothetical protein
MTRRGEKGVKYALLPQIWNDSFTLDPTSKPLKTANIFTDLAVVFVLETASRTAFLKKALHFLAFGLKTVTLV